MQTTHTDADQPGTLRVALKDIVQSPKYQMRQKLDGATVSRYATVLANGSTLPPVKLAEVNGALVLVDGWHRVAAHRKLGTFDIEATVDAASEKDALWMAAQANLTHGLPLKSREVRAVFRAYMDAGKYWKGRRPKSYREIAEDLGNLKTHQTIANWMSKDYRDVARLMGNEERKRYENGPPTLEVVDRLAVEVQQSLDNARAAFRGVQDPDDRKQLIQTARMTLEAMEKGDGWEPVTSDF